MWREYRAVWRTTSLSIHSSDLPRRQRTRRPWMTWTLVLVWTLVHLVFALLAGVLVAPSSAFGFLAEPVFSLAQPWRLLSGCLLHGDAAHLLGNALVFLVVAPLFERDRGPWLLLLLFFLAGAVGFAVHGLTAADPGAPVIGASGGVAGVLGLYPALYRRSLLVLRVDPAIGMMPALPLVVFWLVTQVLWSLLDPGGGVSYASHLGGFVTGYALGALLHRYTRRPPVLRVVH